jgi:MinD superfamily P-loop ATPase
VILAVASGKGGTGKTTVAVSLARAAAAPVQLLDCDVEEPNDRLFFDVRSRTSHEVALPVPEADAAACDGCGDCSRFCRFHAIVTLQGPPLVFPELCHGCGGCVRVCPKRALREVPRRIGVVDLLDAGPVSLVEGRLDVGAALTPPLIRAVKQHLDPDALAILDGPPGRACAAIETLRGADVALFVTEPTPFGLADLEQALAVARTLGIPSGVVVNRAGIGDGQVRDLCRRDGVPILAELPDDRRIAEAGSKGLALLDAAPELRGAFLGLLEEATRLAAAGSGRR